MSFCASIPRCCTPLARAKRPTEAINCRAALVDRPTPQGVWLTIFTWGKGKYTIPQGGPLSESDFWAISTVTSSAAVPTSQSLATVRATGSLTWSTTRRSRSASGQLKLRRRPRTPPGDPTSGASPSEPGDVGSPHKMQLGGETVALSDGTWAPCGSRRLIGS